LADIDEEFEERSVVLHPFFDQPKKDIYETVQFIKHHDDSPAFDSPLTDKSVSHHDTGISLTREYSDTLTSSGLKTKPKHTDTAFDEEAELTDNGLSPIQPDEVGLSANELIEIKKKIGMYDAGNSPIIFMESIALSPFETVTSDVSTITDNVKKIDVANSPIESNKVERNMGTTVDVKQIIMQLEKSGARTENVTSQQSPKRIPLVKTFISEKVHPKKQTIHVDIEKEHKKYETNTMNIQSKLNEVIKTEKCVLEHLEKVVDTSSKNNSELESKLLQIVNIETNMLQSFDKIIDKHDKSVNNLCLKNLEKDIISIDKSDENLKKVDTLDTLQQSSKKCSEDKIEKKYIYTGYKKEENIMEPIKVTGISKELKKLIDDDEKEQERMYRVLLNENNTRVEIYTNKIPVVEDRITPKRVKPITKKDDTKGDSQNIEFNEITTNIKSSIAPKKEEINTDNINKNLKENEQSSTEENEVLKKDTNDKNNKIFYEEDEEDESDIFEKFTREHLKKSLDLSQINVEKDNNYRKDETKDLNFDIVDDEENEINNAKKDKSISFIPKTIEKGLKDITMTLTSIVKKMDVNDMSGKKNESERGDRITEKINESRKQESREIEPNKQKNIKINDLKNSPPTMILSKDSLIKNNFKSDNLKNESIEEYKYNTDQYTNKELEDNFDKGTNNTINIGTNENNKPITTTKKLPIEINKNLLTTEKLDIDQKYKTNKIDSIEKDINKTVTWFSVDIKTLPTNVNTIIKKLPTNAEIKPILKENQKETVQKADSNINKEENQIIDEQENSKDHYKKSFTNTTDNKKNDTKNIAISSYEMYEKTEIHSKTDKDHKEFKITDIYSTTYAEGNLIKNKVLKFENIKINEEKANIEQKIKEVKKLEDKFIKQNNKHQIEKTKFKNNKVKEQSEI